LGGPGYAVHMLSRSVVLTLAALFLAALPAAATAAQRTASATGIANVQGANVYVEVFVEVPEGQNARQAAEAALADQGALAQPPPGPGGPGFTGLVWDALPVVQFYNPLGEPVAAASPPGRDPGHLELGARVPLPVPLRRCDHPLPIDRA
jgi:hypothetical protein